MHIGFPFLAHAEHSPDVSIVQVVLLAGLGLAVVAVVILGRKDLRRLSGQRLWAVAMHALRESIRRRVLLLIPGAMVFIWCAGVFQRSFDEIGAIHQATETCIRTSSALTLLLVILLSAFALPRELESRTIYTLMAKPVTRLEVFLGKAAGLSLVAMLVLGVMGVFSYGYLRYRAGRLVEQAEHRLAGQQRQYDEYLRWVSRMPAATQPDEPGQVVAAAPLVAPRYEPPDAALAQQVQMGLLTAMNYVEPAGPPAVRPSVPAHLKQTGWEWMIAGRGYMAVYAFDLPAGVGAERLWRLALASAIPDAGEEEHPRLRFQVLVDDIPTDGGLSVNFGPRGLAAAGWPLVLGETFMLGLVRGQDGLWHGQFDLPDEYVAAIGSLGRFAVALSAAAAEPKDERLVGFLSPGRGTGQPGRRAGLSLATVAPDGQTQVIEPGGYRMLSRPMSLRQCPISGSPRFGPVENAELGFSGLDRADLPPGELVFQLAFEVDKGSPAAVVTEALVTVVNPRVGGEPLALKAYPSTRMGSFIRVPRDFAAGGELLLLVRPRHPEDMFTLQPDSIRLLARPSSFAANLSKSLAICALQTVVLVVIGVAASVFLSWPVALLVTSVLLIAGNLLDVVRGMLLTRGMQVVDVYGKEHSAAMFARLVNAFFRESTRAMGYLIPDLTRFDPVGFIGRGLNIPLAAVGSDLGWAAFYLVPALVIGYLALRYKELAR